MIATKDRDTITEVAREYGAAKVVLFGLLAAFLYHLANGVRHLLWDAGVGFEKVQARRSAWLVLAVVVIAIAALGYLLFCPVGQQP